MNLIFFSFFPSSVRNTYIYTFLMDGSFISCRNVTLSAAFALRAHVFHVCVKPFENPCKVPHCEINIAVYFTSPDVQ